MSEPAPNPEQRDLIDATGGVTVVDAGAGTGKTFSVARRYAAIVERDGVEPDDVLLATFTDNAAGEMRERIVDTCTYGMRELADAPIQTFHSLCYDVLAEHGYEAPTHLGIDDRITAATSVLDEELVETALFGEFLDRFADDHPEYDDRFRAIDDPEELLDLIKQLAAKGVFPTAEGWYRDGERHLAGDLDAFRELFEAANEPRNGGSKQSRLRSTLADYGRDVLYLPDAPDRTEVRGLGKQVPPELAERAFREDREALMAFVHDVYHGYLAFALRRDYLTFSFLQLFAFVLLCEDDDLRERLEREYVMVDEFQDTSAIQFQLALLLAGTDNLCVVGDWKQSIYGFQYADVENILSFEERLEDFAARLNADRERVSVTGDDVREVRLERNYRSTQSILDVAEEALSLPATGGDEVDTAAFADRDVSLVADTDRDHSRIEATRLPTDEERAASAAADTDAPDSREGGTGADDEPTEYDLVLDRIARVVGNDDYAVEGEDGGLRPPEFGDVAVLTRTRDFGRELLAAAEAAGLPMAYEGGVELFRTDPAKRLLAWLRVLEDDRDRGWALVLEDAGYPLQAIEHALETESYPDELVAFREELAALETLGGVARRVFARYGHDGPTADAVLDTLLSVHDATTMTRGDLIRFVERAIEAGSTHEVHAGGGTDAVTVQTIHAAKGLEHPIVVLANMNRYRFPPSGGGANTLCYEEPVGLRQREVYDETAHGVPHVYRNWRTDVLRAALPRGYDEERRLLYVAMTRAESHLLFTAGEQPNTFLEELPVDVEPTVPDPGDLPAPPTAQTSLRVAPPAPEGPRGHTPHTLMDETVFEDVEGGRGTAFGQRVHDYAEAVAEALDAGEPVPDPGEALAEYPAGDRDAPDFEHIAALLRELAGAPDAQFRVETDAVLPLDVDGERVAVSGTVDLLHVTPERVRIFDYKTDRGRHGRAEYRTQLSVYHHVVADAYPERAVTASIYWTHAGDCDEVAVLSPAALAGIVRDADR